MTAEPKLSSYAEDFPKISVDNLLELFRELRQSTTLKSEQQLNSIELIPAVKLLADMADYLKSGRADNIIDKFVLNVCARVGVQFLGNLIVENEENQNLLWNQSELLRKIFFHKDTKLKNYISMVYLNLILSVPSSREELLKDDEFINELIDEAMLGLTEFPQFIVEKFLEFNLFDKFYTERRKSIHKIYILDMLSSLIRNNDKFTLDLKTVQFISDEFKNESEIMLNGRRLKIDNNCGTNENNVQNDENPQLSVKLLSLLCSLSIHDNYKSIISDNTSLIINTIYVLRAMKMIEIAKQEKGIEIFDNNEPIIGFKADLIRLLANVCWKHRKNQDLIRENNCIGLILECCKLDESNAFICEWSILAIRNLCEDNQENMAVIASLKQANDMDAIGMNAGINLDQSGQNHSAQVDEVNRQSEQTNLKNKVQSELNKLENIVKSVQNNLENVVQSVQNNLENIVQSVQDNLENNDQSEPNSLDMNGQKEPNKLENNDQSEPNSLDMNGQKKPNKLENNDQSEFDSLDMNGQKEPNKLENINLNEPNNLENKIQSEQNTSEKIEQREPNNLENMDHILLCNLDNVVQIIQNNLENVYQSVQNNLDIVVQSEPNNLETVVQSVQNNLENMVQSEPNHLENKILSEQNTLEKIEQREPNNLKNIDRILVRNLENVIQIIQNDLENVFQSVQNNLEAVVQSEPNNLENMVQNEQNNLENKIQSEQNNSEKIEQRELNNLENMAPNLLSNLENVVQSVQNDLEKNDQSALNNLENKVQSEHNNLEKNDQNEPNILENKVQSEPNNLEIN